MLCRASGLHVPRGGRLVEVLVLLLVVVVPAAFSVHIHDPAVEPLMGNPGFKYTDIVHLSNTIFVRGERWYSKDAFKAFRSGRIGCPASYVDYKFEYPPVVGLIWYTSSCIAFALTGSVESAIRAHYYIQSAVIAVFHAIQVYTLHMLLKSVRRGLKGLPRLLVFLLPSVFIHLIYNWDAIASALLLLGLLQALRGRYFTAGLLQGLSVSTKVVTAGAPFYYAVKLLRHGEEVEAKLRFLLGVVVGGVLPFMLFYATSPHGFTEFIQHHMGWYCENCIYLPLIRDIWSDLHRTLFYTIAVAIALVFALYAYPWRGISVEYEYKYLFLAVTSLILFNYVFPPQMLLLITPLATLALSTPGLLLYCLADVFNAMIITTYFTNPPRHATSMGVWLYNAVCSICKKPSTSNPIRLDSHHNP